MKRFGVFNRGLRRLPALGELMGAEIVPVFFSTSIGLDATLGWGRRRYGKRAARVAQAGAIPFTCIEDGFLRSIGLGKNEAPLSIVVDDLGIYYDATTASRLEVLIGAPSTADEQARAASLTERWRRSRVSKYNHAREASNIDELRRGTDRDRSSPGYVLVVDQTLGDASIRFGLADASCFDRMLDAALTENPACTVVLKVHPEVMAGHKKGHFDLATLARNPRIRILAQDVHPVSLIEHAHAVYVVTSQIGFESLLWGKRVRTFGMPFYAGWGLTEDELRAPDRRHPVPLKNLVHAALVEYPRYIDPETGKRCAPERLIEWMGLQRRMRERFAPEVYAPGFSNWKKPIVRAFFQGSDVKFVHRMDQVPNEAMLAVWGRREGVDGKGIRRIVRLEDGFLRSVGLGADLIRPLSWVIDERGIYYDATQPSDLEQILQHTEFEASLLLRARMLRERLVAAGLTKYNVGTVRWQRPQTHSQLPSPACGRRVGDSKHCFEGDRKRSGLYKHPPLQGAHRLASLCRYAGGQQAVRIPCFAPNPLPPAGEGAFMALQRGVDTHASMEGGITPATQRVILVPGQVESDASLAYGAPGICKNLDLLRAVRKANPDAYLLYKPHPDVVAGLRRQGQDENDAARWCDEVVVEVSMGALLLQIDEVHTLTSLTGFEALLRGKRVVCYGQPFYAGWGLTQDMSVPARRTRKLSLDALVAGVLILYPAYVSRTTGKFTTPERALDELLAWRENTTLTSPWWRKGLRRIYGLFND